MLKGVFLKKFSNGGANSIQMKVNFNNLVSFIQLIDNDIQFRIFFV